MPLSQYVFFSVLCFSFSAILYKKSRSNPLNKGKSAQGYILENQVTHARLIPAKSTHAFTYPTISLLVSLEALENHSLDIGRGWVFGYGGLWGRIIGLRSHSYLTDSGGENKTIREKLDAVLMGRNYLDDESMYEDAWMMTMPSLIGFEGINPLTVYFCYRSGALWLTVLEIHNTFGESHVHVLEVGTGEDEVVSRGYDHQWTFLREFHVSPFNDRSGFYTISIKSPSHPPTPVILEPNSIPDSKIPRPTVRVHLYEALPELSASGASVPGPLKLTALLRVKTARRLTATALFTTLGRAPFTLMLSFTRILYVAWILHYKKRLDVFIRPEPLPAAPEWGSGVDLPVRGLRPGGGIKWMGEGILERYARRCMEAFLRRRVEETGITVTLIPPNLTTSPNAFRPSSQSASDCHLNISYLSPQFFAIMFLSPSAAHALLLGSDSEGLFYPSSRDLFMTIFSPAPLLAPSLQVGMSSRQRLRNRYIPETIVYPIPTSHPFDNSSTISSLTSTVVILTTFFFAQLESWIFRVSHARPIPGQEPWKKWERADLIFQAGI